MDSQPSLVVGVRPCQAHRSLPGTGRTSPAHAQLPPRSRPAQRPPPARGPSSLLCHEDRRVEAAG
eukprot:5464807-Heterocapsa_arctica.AAC.1